jgi:hypothetical protein
MLLLRNPIKGWPGPDLGWAVEPYDDDDDDDDYDRSSKRFSSL